MYSIEQLSDFDIFFYYGQNDLELETKSDIFQNLLQSKRSLYYDRWDDSSGIHDYENRPNSIYLNIMMPFDIVYSLARRNSNVSAGENEYPDRRIAVSQSEISVKRDKQGIELDLYYIPLADIKQKESVSIPLPVNIGG